MKRHPISGWLGAAVVGAIAAIGVVRYDLRIKISYTPAIVRAVMQVPGKDLAERLVMVDVDGTPRRIFLGDRLIFVAQGSPVCLERSQFLFRSWTRYAIALPGYCPTMRSRAPVGLSSPDPRPNMSQP